MLAGRRDQGGLNEWMDPETLQPCEGILWVLTDREGINRWGVRLVLRPMSTESCGNSDGPPGYDRVYARGTAECGAVAEVAP